MNGELEARNPKETRLTERVRRFLSAGSFAVVGVSADPTRFGRKVYEALLSSGRVVFGVNPKMDKLNGRQIFPNLRSLPVVPEVVSIITPPAVTASVINDAIQLGVGKIWIQPGAEHTEAIKMAREAGIEVIYGGACIIVALAEEWSEQHESKA